MGFNPYSLSNVAEVAQQQEQAFELHLKGWSYRRIAVEMGVSVGTVSNRISAAVAERVDPKVDEYRAVELEKIEKAESKLWEQIEAGKQVARNVEVFNKLSERRSRLLGLDAPEKKQVEVTEQVPTEVLAAIEQARARVAEREQELREQHHREE